MSTSARQPTASARRTSSAVAPRSRSQYSCNHRSAPDSATRSIGVPLSIATVNGTPAARAARAVAASPSGCTRLWYAIGAMASGSVDAVPASRVAVDTRDTSRSIRGTRYSSSNARRFAAAVSSAPLPPETKSHAAAGITSRASPV